MSSKSVLILGGSGLIGTHLALRLREEYKVAATYHHHPVRMPGVTYLPARIQNVQWMESLIFRLAPDVIVYLIGSNDPKYAKEEHKASEVQHAAGLANVLKTAGLTNTRLVYISNGYVFQGNKGNYHEEDNALPSSYLGRHKLAGENYLASKSYNYLIIRSGPMLGIGNGKRLSMFDKIRIALERKEQVFLQNSELHNFTLVSDLVEFVPKAIELLPVNSITHFGGLTKLTHLQLGQIIAQKMGYDPKLIQKSEVYYLDKFLEGEDLVDFSLNCSQACKTLTVKPKDLEESLETLLRSC